MGYLRFYPQLRASFKLSAKELTSFNDHRVHLPDRRMGAGNPVFVEHQSQAVLTPIPRMFATLVTGMRWSV